MSRNSCFEREHLFCLWGANLLGEDPNQGLPNEEETEVESDVEVHEIEDDDDGEDVMESSVDELPDPVMRCSCGCGREMPDISADNGCEGVVAEGGQEGETVDYSETAETEEVKGESREEEMGETSPQRLRFANPDNLPAVSACLDPHTQFWRADRIDFLLHMFSGYTHGLRVFQSLREELNREFGQRERALRSRELQLYNDCHRVNRGRDLDERERRLAEREAELSRREADLLRREERLDEEHMRKLQEFLAEIEGWGMYASSQERPPSPRQ